jgi:hypothetical protein
MISALIFIEKIVKDILSKGHKFIGVIKCDTLYTTPKKHRRPDKIAYVTENNALPNSLPKYRYFKCAPDYRNYFIIPTNYILTVLRHSLFFNIARARKGVYYQKYGAPMGNPLSIPLCNAFALSRETSYNSNLINREIILKYSCSKRYIDDKILISFKHPSDIPLTPYDNDCSEVRMNESFYGTPLSSCTINVEQPSEVVVYCGCDLSVLGPLIICTPKCIEGHMYNSMVPYVSFLPKHQIHGIVIGCFSRARALCNEYGWAIYCTRVILSECNRLFYLGYPEKMVMACLKRARVDRKLVDLISKLCTF